MKILCLYNNDCALELFERIKAQGHETVLMKDRLSADRCRENDYDLTVSYTYRYILSEEIISALKDNVVNLHNSFLPFNRGASPNIWSIVENTPRGVTLHYIDRELDKGYIIAQRFVPLSDRDTLSSSYASLDKAAKELFMEAFYYYPYWAEMKKLAVGKGTYHSTAGFCEIEKYIDSYDMSAVELIRRIKIDSIE